MGGTYLDLLASYGISGAHPGGLPLTRKILAGLPLSSETLLLDLGCGTGQTLAYVVKTYGLRAVGVDINNQMLMQAERRLSREDCSAQLVYADVTQMPFPANTFDVALSESVTVFTSIRPALGEYARVLKPGGSLLIVEMTAAVPLSQRELGDIKRVYEISQVPDSSEWESLLAQSGFCVEKILDIRPEPTLKFTSYRMLRDFTAHLNILRSHGHKLKYTAYYCVLQK